MLYCSLINQKHAMPKKEAPQRAYLAGWRMGGITNQELTKAWLGTWMENVSALPHWRNHCSLHQIFVMLTAGGYILYAHTLSLLWHHPSLVVNNDLFFSVCFVTSWITRMQYIYRSRRYGQWYWRSDLKQNEWSAQVLKCYILTTTRYNWVLVKVPVFMEYIPEE